MTPRLWLGRRLARVADWLLYPRQPECAAPGCYYYASSGVHQSADECVMACVEDPSRRVEHHAFVDPRWWRRVNFGRR